MSSGEILVNVVFYLFAIIAIGGAVAVAASQNIVRSAFALLAVLFAVAAFYAFMRADFIFAAQILIYVGGILVLIIFAIMLTHRITDVRVSNESAPGPAAIFATLCMLFSLVVVIATYKWSRSERPLDVSIAVGKGPVGAQLSMLQADGIYDPDKATGIVRGGLMMDGRGYLAVRILELPESHVAARFRLERAPKPAKAGDPRIWKAHEFKGKDRAEEFRDVVFAKRTTGGGSEARLELSGLEPGSYRWGVSLVPRESNAKATDVVWAGGADTDLDFQVEAGLVRPIGLALMGPYLLPFEVVSVLLLASLIGAAFLARKEVKGANR